MFHVHPGQVGGTPLQQALRASRGSLLNVFMFSCGSNILLLAPSIYLLQIYDRVLSSGSLDTLLMLTIIVAAAVLVHSLLDALRRGMLSRLGIWLEDRLRRPVFNSAFEHARHKNAAVAAEATRDLGALRQFLGSPAMTALFDLPWAIVFFGVLFLIDPLLGAIGVIGATVMLTCAMISEILTRSYTVMAQAAEGGMYQRFASAISRVQTVRALGMLNGICRLMSRDAAAAGAAQQVVLRRSETLQTVSRTTRALVQVVVMGAAAWLVLRHHLNPGIIFVSSLLIGRGLAPIEGVIAGWKGYGSARLAYRRLTEVLQSSDASDPANRLPLPEPFGALTVDSVTYVPPGTNTIVLQAISLNLAPGQCLGIVGPSGAGKTSLARIIMGIAAPAMGRVRIDGVDVANCLDQGGARHLGYLPQETELFDGTIRDNICRLTDGPHHDVVEAARLVDLHETIMQMPDGYETPVGAGGVQLSGGQRQCIGLARAFFGRPRLVVLDEPNANLDDVGERALHQAVVRMKEAGSSVVIITHRIGILDTADQIALLRRGVLSDHGSRSEIFEKYFRPPGSVPAPESSPPPVAATESASPQPSIPAANSPAGRGDPGRIARSIAASAARPWARMRLIPTAAKPLILEGPTKWP